MKSLSSRVMFVGLRIVSFAKAGVGMQFNLQEYFAAYQNFGCTIVYQVFFFRQENCNFLILSL